MLAIIGSILILTSVGYFFVKYKKNTPPYSIKGAIFFFVIGWFMIINYFLGHDPR